MVKVRGWEFGVRADGSIIVRKYVDERGSGNVQAYEVFSHDEFQTVMRGMQEEADVFDDAEVAGCELTGDAEANDARNALGARKRGLEEAAAKAKAEADAADAAAKVADEQAALAAAASAAAKDPEPVIVADPPAAPTSNVIQLPVTPATGG